MRRRSIAVLLLPVLFTAVVGVPGCETPPPPSPVTSDHPIDPQHDPVAAAQQHADRLNQAMNHLPPARPSEPYGGVPEVRWITPGNEPGQRRRDVQAVAYDTSPELPTDILQEPGEAEPADTTEIDEPPVKVLPSRAQLLTDLLGQVREGNDTDLTKALIAASLSVADPNFELDQGFVDALDPRRQDLIHRYHDLLVTLNKQIAADQTDLDRATLVAELDRLFGEQPVTIDTVKLCRRVMGFGIFDSFENFTFLAGRDQPVIVYVEVDHFKPVETSTSNFEVRLNQEVLLFNETDGLVVWRHEPVEIVDTSRNRRSDFFTVQRISLPARLSVGKYRMKVRITDKHGGSVDETTLPLEIVADEALVQTAPIPATETLPLAPRNPEPATP